MSKVICLAIVIISSMMLLHLVFMNVRNRNLSPRKTWGIYLFLTLNSFLAFTWLHAGGPLCFCMSAGLWMTLFVLYIIESPSLPLKNILIISYIALGSQTALIIYNVLRISGTDTLPPAGFYCAVHVAEAFLCVLAYVYSQWYRIRDVKTLLSTGSAWTGLEASVYSVYAIILVCCPLVSLYLYMRFPGNGLLCSLILIPELGMMGALCFRNTHDVRLVVMQKHETLILESLKVSQIEMSNAGNADMYKELYGRLVAYFEEEKPFLNSRLTINDVVRKVYSNRLYISRAISQCTGRNFCQFVNYYRISHAVECFRQNPEMKVSELSEMSGFNSPVTFNVAFHLFMNENPSDWLRKERTKILNKKK